MLARFGGSVTVGGVRIATVTALHSNGLDPDYIGGDLGKAMKEAGIAGDVGLATGYVLRFSNGLVAYLSGDTGITADQELVVRGHYNAKLAVMNIGDGFTTGPAEAAYVINELVKPASVIASHANEVGTVGGKVRAGQQDRSLHQGRRRCRCTSRSPARRWSSTPAASAPRAAEGRPGGSEPVLGDAAAVLTGLRAVSTETGSLGGRARAHPARLTAAREGRSPPAGSPPRRPPGRATAGPWRTRSRPGRGPSRRG